MKVEELKHELAQLKPLTHAQVEDKDSQLEEMTNMKHHNGKGRKSLGNIWTSCLLHRKRIKLLPKMSKICVKLLPNMAIAYIPL